MANELMSSSVPPPTWNEASEMPKNSITLSPATALTAITRKAVKALMRIVRRRSSAVKDWVKWMKNGTTPIGLTIASRAISGLSRSMRDGSQPAGGTGATPNSRGHGHGSSGSGFVRGRQNNT